MENWLLKQARLSGSKPALYYQDRMLTFQEVSQEVQNWAEKIKACSLESKGFIGVLGANTKTTYFLILAIHQLGYPVVLFNFRLSEAELQQQLDEAAPLLLLTDPQLSQWATLTYEKGLLLTYDQLHEQTGVTYVPVATFDNDQLADMLYTSGSTGRPKGVLQTFGNHFYSAIGTGLNFQLTNEDAWICAVPLFHISGLSILMRSLVYGLAIYLEPKFDAARMNALLRTQTATIVSVVPYMLKQLLKQLPETAHYQPKFKGLFLGGGPIDPKTLQQCKNKNIPVVQSYGMTETASNIVALNFQDAQTKTGAVGQALFPVQLRLSTKHEIQIKSPTLAIGYYHQETAYQAKFTEDHWFKTGDVGEIDSEGFLYVRGRLDTMFISGGENIFPNEIEACYSHYPGIQEIVILPQTDAKWGAIPVALIVWDQGTPLNENELVQFGRKNLAHYKVPTTFYLVPTLPKTGNGKMDYATLQKLDFATLIPFSGDATAKKDEMI